MKEDVINKLDFALLILKDLMNSDSCKKLIGKLDKNVTFIFSGVGKNWYICEKEVKTFISMGLNARSLDCTHALHGDLGMLMNPNENKYLFFISKSGKTEEMHKLIDVVIDLRSKSIIKNLHLVFVCLNSEIENFIDTSKFDFVLKPMEAYKYFENIELDDRNLVPTLSINITQSILDYIGVSVYESNEALVENYKYNHLGGSNGAKLGMEKYLKEI